MKKPENKSSVSKPTTYKIVFLDKALKELKKLPSKISESIFHHIDLLATEPYPHGYKKLKGKENLFRIRHGNYRVVYSILNNELTIEVIRVANRKDVYRGL